jgi:beta-glucosidase
VILACVGENSYCETPGNINDLTLSANQRNLVKALAKTGKPIILILNEGRPRVINEIEPMADAIIDILLPGNYGGDALAALISGEENFSGKLPFTYPKYVNSLHTYDFKVSEKREMIDGAYNYDAKMDVQWSFGDGLSYTTFEYSDLTVDKNAFRKGDTIRFSVNVTNTGDRTGKETVLLYSSDLVASMIPDVKRLRAFDKVELAPGETKTVDFVINADELAFAAAGML